MPLLTFIGKWQLCKCFNAICAELLLALTVVTRKNSKKWHICSKNIPSYDWKDSEKRFSWPVFPHGHLFLYLPLHRNDLVIDYKCTPPASWDQFMCGIFEIWGIFEIVLDNYWMKFWVSFMKGWRTKWLDKVVRRRTEKVGRKLVTGKKRRLVANLWLERRESWSQICDWKEEKFGSKFVTGKKRKLVTNLWLERRESWSQICDW